MSQPQAVLLTEEQTIAKYGNQMGVINPQPAAPTPAPAETIVEKAVEPAPPAPAPAPSNTVSPKEIFGEQYESWDQVKDRLKRAEENEPKLKEYESKVLEYQPAEPYVAELNKALKRGINRDAFDRFYTSDPENLKHEEVISLQYQLRDGLSKEDADFLVQERYKLGEFGEGLLEGSAEQRLASISLKSDANAAKSYVEQQRAELMVSPFEKAVEARVKEFEPVVPAIVNEISSIKTGDFTYPVPKETVAAVNEHLNTLLKSEMLDMDKATPENIAQLKEIAKAQVLAKEFDNILRFVTTEYEKKALEEKVNPRPIAGVNAPPATLSQAEKNRAIADAANRAG